MWAPQIIPMYCPAQARHSSAQSSPRVNIDMIWVCASRTLTSLPHAETTIQHTFTRSFIQHIRICTCVYFIECCANVASARAAVGYTRLRKSLSLSLCQEATTSQQIAGRRNSRLATSQGAFHKRFLNIQTVYAHLVGLVCMTAVAAAGGSHDEEMHCLANIRQRRLE